MKYKLKKGKRTFSPRVGRWRLHSGIMFAEWRGQFAASTWHEPDPGQPQYNLGSGWSYGRERQNALRWVWRPVWHQGCKMQELSLYAVENGIQTTSSQSLLLPVEEDFFVQLKTNGTFASLAARTFTGDWQMITVKWGARAKRGFWLGISLGEQHTSPEDMTLHLKRLIPV